MPDCDTSNWVNDKDPGGLNKPSLAAMLSKQMLSSTDLLFFQISHKVFKFRNQND
jgi:hypothetical protein